MNSEKESQFYLKKLIKITISIWFESKFTAINE